MFTLGYNTNGLAHHHLADALPMLAEMGYGAVALTPDVGQLDPFRATVDEVRDLRRLAQDLGLAIVVESGARYLLDARRKHYPSLLENEPFERARRLDFLCRSVDLARDLGSPLVSIWSGVAPQGPLADGTLENGERIWERLCEGLCALLAHARERDVAIAFEPEPGMFIERPAQYRELLTRLGAPGAGLGLTLDLGHLVVTGDLPVENTIAEYAAQTTNVHLDDCPAGIHQHGLFGTGDLDLQAAINALVKSGYGGVASVELSRDSHRGPLLAEQALRQLQTALEISS